MPRFGAVGQHGSLAMIERLILSVKLVLRLLPLVPLRADAFRRDVRAAIDWYNSCRPHTSLRGRTPNEVYDGAFPANRHPRFEPRNRWPRGSPGAKPHTLVRSKPGAIVKLEVTFHNGRRHLPVVTVKRAG